MTRTSDSPGFFKSLRNEWDATLAVLCALTFALFIIPSTRSLVDARTYLIASITTGVTVATGWLVAMRWLSDLFHKTEYGEIVRAIDFDERRASRPYWIVIVSGYTLALLSIFTIIAYNNLPRFVLSVLLSLILGATVYCILGSISLGRVTRRHQARASRVKAIKEASLRLAREQKRNGSK
ncbi:hypothetical protein [Rhodococcoides fascians]|uniref:hypothetical protein n=1 Tax=Rhodococcoides fascians TaxID=1828 RepID=UPI00050CD987|nr:hypothetical protein [Rhodococcus fascians]